MKPFWFKCPLREICPLAPFNGGPLGDCWGVYDEVVNGMRNCTSPYTTGRVPIEIDDDDMDTILPESMS